MEFEKSELGNQNDGGRRKSYTETIKEFVGDKVQGIKESIFYGEKEHRDTMTGRALFGEDEDHNDENINYTRREATNVTANMKEGDNFRDNKTIGQNDADKNIDALNFNHGENAARDALNQELRRDDQELGRGDQEKGTLESAKDTIKENFESAKDKAADKLEEFCHAAEKMYDEAMEP